MTMGGNVMLRFATSFWRDQKGATAIEYGLIGALIAVVIISMVAQVGGRVAGTFQLLAGAM